MAKQRLEAEIGLNTNKFFDSLDSVVGGLGNMAREFGTLAGGIALTTKVFSDFGEMLKNTTTGFKAINIATAAYKQTLYDLTQGQITQINNLVDIIALQTKYNDVLLQNKFDGIEIASLTAKINELRYDASDATLSETEKINKLNEALKLNAERREYLKKDIAEELRIVGEMLQKQPKNLELQTKWAELMKEAKMLLGEDTEARRINAQITGIQAEQAKKHADQLKRISDLGARLGEAFFNDRKVANMTTVAGYRLSQITGKETVTPSKGLGFDINAENLPLAPMAGADIVTAQIIQQNKLWAEQEQIILSLADSFSEMFGQAGEGFQSMVDMAIAGVKRLVLELAAKAAILALLQMFMPGKAILTLANLFPQIMGMIGGGGMSLGGGGSTGFGLAGLQTQQAIQVYGVTRGKDIHWSNKRYY